MAESSVSSSTPYFTLGQELSLPNFSDEHSDEEPIPKRLKLDDEVLDCQSTTSHSASDMEAKLPIPVESEAGNKAEESDAAAVGIVNGTCDAGEASLEVIDTSASTIEAPCSSEIVGPEDVKSPIKPAVKKKLVKKKMAVDSCEGKDLEPSLVKKKGKKDKLRKKKVKTKSGVMRKNIREILTTTQLEAETLEAQREEQERIQRMNAKLQQVQQQQQQNNLMKLLSSAPTSTYAGPMSENVEKLFAQKGLSTDSAQVPKVIDEVTLSSDDEAVPVESVPGRGLSSSSKFIPGFRNGLGNTFLNSGGMVLSPSFCGSQTDLDGDLSGEKSEEERLPGEDSDSDDCVILSPTSYVDEVEKEEKDDDINVPDEFGRVLINVAHPSADPDIYLAPQIASIIKPHQIGGIRFLYDNVVESVDRFNTSNGFGCILAHSMGLGKTIQAVSFCDIFLRHTSARTVLIIVPINTIQNWLHEFNYWIPLSGQSAESSTKTISKPKSQSQSSNGAGSPADIDSSISVKYESSSGSDTMPNNGDFRPRNFQVFVLNETVKTLKAREKIIREWKTQGGVLLLGYEMYRMLALKRLKRSTKKKLASLNLKDRDTDSIDEEVSLANIYSDIVNPGPDLVICDEGHRIKNSGASISQALKAVRTKRRVVLTGYPLQNNLMEYWCMVDFVRPNYLGTKAEFSNMFERPITNGQCQDSSTLDKQLMRYRSHVLHTLLEGFVQRRSHLVLQSALPPKNEWVFLLKMTPIQYSLYKEFIRYLREDRPEKTNEGAPSVNPIKAFAVCCKIWNHPDALYNVVKKHDDVLDDLDLDDIGAEDGTKKVGRKPRRTAKQTKAIAAKAAATAAGVKRFTLAEAMDHPGFDPHLLGLDADSMANIPTTVSNQCYNQNNTDGRSISLDWAVPVFKDYQAEVLENGVKFQLLLAIVDEVEKIGDKLLVFSQSLLTLDLIELFLGKRLNWKKNVQYFRLDGSTSGLEREKLIGDFNHKDTLRVFLVSTRAGSLGINLIGANRVVVFDASWNPCHDAQAVCRVYRYGQKKECQIYRFVTDSSLEKRIYDRQINKRGMADRVVDEMNPETNLSSKDVTSFLVLDQAQMDDAQEAKHKFDLTKFSDPVLQSLLVRCGDCLTKEPFEHESLLIDRKENKLSAKEKRQARRNYEHDKKQAANQTAYTYQRPSYSAFYPKTESVPSPSYNSNVHSSLGSSNSSYIINQGSSSAYTASSSYINSSSTFREKIRELHEIQQRRTEQVRNVEHRTFPLQTLKQHGIDCRFMVLKKDAFIQDPSGGSEIFLGAGEKINIFRSKQGIYIQIANGRMIAIKPTSADAVSTVRGIPLIGEVPQEKLQSLVFSLLRPAKPSLSSYNPYKHPNFAGRSGSVSSTYTAGGNKLKPNILDKSRYFPPTLQKLPPTPGLFPASFQSRSPPITFRAQSSGDEITIVEGGLDPPRRQRSSFEKLPVTTATSSSDADDDIQVIAFNSGGRGSTSRNSLNGSRKGSQSRTPSEVPLSPFKVKAFSNASHSEKLYHHQRTPLVDRLTPPDMSITPVSNSGQFQGFGGDTGPSDSPHGQSSNSGDGSPSTMLPPWTQFGAGANSLLGKHLLQGGSDQSSSVTHSQSWLQSESYLAKLKDMVASSSAKTHSPSGGQSTTGDSSLETTSQSMYGSPCTGSETLDSLSESVPTTIQYSEPHQYRSVDTSTSGHPMQNLLLNFGNSPNKLQTYHQHPQYTMPSVYETFGDNLEFSRHNFRRGASTSTDNTNTPSSTTNSHFIPDFDYSNRSSTMDTIQVDQARSVNLASYTNNSNSSGSSSNSGIDPSIYSSHQDNYMN